MKKNLSRFIAKFEFIDSIIGLIGVVIILGSAIGIQLLDNEHPCPLCLLQRAALVNLGLAMLMNVRYGVHVFPWALGILSAIVGIAVSMRQILLHINSPIGMGATFLDIHMYTWCFIAFALAMVGCTIMLIIYPERNICIKKRNSIFLPKTSKNVS